MLLSTQIIKNIIRVVIKTLSTVSTDNACRQSSSLVNGAPLLNRRDKFQFCALRI